MKKILSIEYAHGVFSWGITAGAILEELGSTGKRVNYMSWKRNEVAVKKDVQTHDVILTQNATQLITLEQFKNVVSRLCDNRIFDEHRWKNVHQYLERMSKCKAVIATNKKLMAIAQQVNPHVFLIPNGIDLTKWGARSRTFPAKRPFIVGFAGNVAQDAKSRYKGFPIIKSVCESRTDVELKGAIYKLAQIPYDRMKSDFYDVIDVVALLSEGEGCSNTLMEACACGVPIITTRTAGYHGDFMVDGENVIFCERTKESFSAALDRLINDPQLYTRLCHGSRRFAEEHHDIKNVADQYRKVFALCEEKAPASKTQSPVPVTPQRGWKVPPFWKGQDVWIIGGGPSINKVFGIPNKIVQGIKSGENTPADIGVFVKAIIGHCNIIGVNNAYQLGSFLDMLYFGDCSWFQKHEQNYAQMPGIVVSSCSRQREHPQILYLPRSRTHEFGISEDRTELVWNHNSGCAAINLAVHLGAKRIFLLGFDMMQQGDYTHWHYQHRDALQRGRKAEASYGLQREGLPHIKKAAAKLGVEIYNVNSSDSTTVTEFPIISLEEACKLQSSSSEQAVVSVEKTSPAIAPRIAVCCLLWQGKSRHDRHYTEEWVEKLQMMVKKHLPLAFDFYCFSNVQFTSPGIKVVPLEQEFPQWWGKMSYFGHPKLAGYDFCICLDLDVFIVDSLMPFIEIYEAHGRPDLMPAYTPAVDKESIVHHRKQINYMYQTSIFFFCPAKVTDLGKKFRKYSKAIVEQYWGDQDWLAIVAPGRHTFPESFTMKLQIWQNNGHDFGNAKVVFAITDKNDVAVKNHPELLEIWGDLKPQEPIVEKPAGKKLRFISFAWKDGTGKSDQIWKNAEMQYAYITRLYNQLKRKVSVPFELIVFTNIFQQTHPKFTFDKNIQIRPLKGLPGLDGCFPKVKAFDPANGFDDGCLNIVIDLDVVLVGSLDFFATYTGDFICRGGIKEPRQIEGGIVAFRPNERTEALWKEFMSNYPKLLREYKGSERYLYRAWFTSPQYLETQFPGFIRSYKWELKPQNNKLTPDCRIVVFHGLPRPHDVMDINWVRNNWK